jgi:hypothetical protein
MELEGIPKRLICHLGWKSDFINEDLHPQNINQTLTSWLMKWKPKMVDKELLSGAYKNG